MADFINFEADIERDDEEIGEEDDKVSNISDVGSENSFIDNQEVKTDVNVYRNFANVENDIDNDADNDFDIKVLKDAIMKHLKIKHLINLMKYQIYVKVLKKKLKLTILKTLKSTLKNLIKVYFHGLTLIMKKFTIKSKFYQNTIIF